MTQLPDQTSQTLSSITPAAPSDSDASFTPFETRNPDAFAWLTTTDTAQTKPEEA
jgi:hypothetical protein